MAQLVMEIGNAAQVTRIQTAFAAEYGYQPTIPDPQNPTQTIPNPEGLNAFSKRMVARFIKDVVKGYEAKRDAAIAIEAANASADAMVIT